MDSFSHEIDIMYMESCNEFTSAMDNSLLAFLEGSDVPAEKTEGAITRIISKIKEMLQKAIDAITSLFDKKKITEASNEINKKVKEDPSLKNKKVSFKSNRKAIELDKVTLEDIYKAKDFNEVEARMEKYRKQRNKAIVVGSVVTIAVGAVGAFVFKKQKSLLDETKQEKAKAEAKANAYRQKLGKSQQEIIKIKEENKQLAYDNSDMRKELQAKNKAGVVKVRLNRKGREISQKIDNLNKDVRTQTAKINATAEVASEMAKSCVDEGKNIISTLVDSTKSLGSKVTGVVKGLDNTKSIIKDSKNNRLESELSTLQTQLNSTKAEGRKTINAIKSVKASMEKLDKDSEEYKNKSKRLDSLVTKRKKLHDSVEVLKKAIADKNSK